VATMAGAIRGLLIELDGLPAEPLVALVPVSVRSDDAESGGNLVQVMLIELPTNASDPATRVRLTHEALRDAKERHNAVPATALRGADEFLMPALFIRASRAATMASGMAGVTSNAVISNVPGPPTPVYIAGARVEAFYPVGGVIEGFGFSTIVFSYCTDLQVGFTSTGGTADPWRLAKAYTDSHRELVGMVPSRTTPTQGPAESK
jgi:diacylglycerol O-acyltransferase / wax synthase